VQGGGGRRLRGRQEEGKIGEGTSVCIIKLSLELPMFDLDLLQVVVE